MLNQTQNKIPGKLITIEGIEGVGKSTNMAFVAKLIQKYGMDVVLTREPGGTPVAESIRQVLLRDYSEQVLPETEALLYYAGRFQHVKMLIEPALAKGQWVLSDRFYDASFAYQGAGRKISLTKLEKLHSWVLGNFSPHLTIYLDAPAEVGLARIQVRGKPDRIEKETITFFDRVRQAYISLAERFPDRIYRIDATQPLQMVQSNITNIFKKIDFFGSSKISRE